MPSSSLPCRGVSLAITDFRRVFFFDFLVRWGVGLRAMALAVLAAMLLTAIGLRPAPGLFPPRGIRLIV